MAWSCCTTKLRQAVSFKFLPVHAVGKGESFMVSPSGLSVNHRAAFIGYILRRNIQLKAEKFPCRVGYRESVGVFFFFFKLSGLGN